MDDFDLGNEFNEFEAELKALKERITEVESENAKLKDVVIENGLEEELEGIDFTSVEEQLCVNGIRHIAQLVRDQDFSDRDIKSFQTLYQTLRTIRGKKEGMVKPSKQESAAELLKIVGNLSGK